MPSPERCGRGLDRLGVARRAASGGAGRVAWRETCSSSVSRVSTTQPRGASAARARDASARARRRSRTPHEVDDQHDQENNDECSDADVHGVPPFGSSLLPVRIRDSNRSPGAGGGDSRRSIANAAVHENSSRAVPVAGERREVLGEPAAVHELERPRAQLVGEPGLTARAETADDEPVRVHPRRALPVAVVVELGTVGRDARDREARPGVRPAQLFEQSVDVCAAGSRSTTAGRSQPSACEAARRSARCVSSSGRRRRPTAARARPRCGRRTRPARGRAPPSAPAMSTSARLATVRMALKATSSICTESSAGRRRSSKPCRLRPVGEYEHAQPVGVARRSAFGAKRVSRRRKSTSRVSRSRSTRRIQPGVRIRRSSRIHGGVVSSPHSHGWMSVIRPVCRRSRSRYSHSW